MSSKQVISLLKKTYSQWSDRQAPRLGASVAFYSILSFAPLLVLITALIAVVFGHESALSAGLAHVGRSFGQLVTMPTLVMRTIKLVVSFAIIAELFGLMFKYVPAAKIPWKAVLVGAVDTALLFRIGKHLLGPYLGKASVSKGACNETAYLRFDVIVGQGSSEGHAHG